MDRTRGFERLFRRGDFCQEAGWFEISYDMLESSLQAVEVSVTPQSGQPTRVAKRADLPDDSFPCK